MDKMLLSLDTDTFSVLKEQFDRVLNKTLGNMEMKGANTATITMKLDIELDKDSRDTGNGFKEFTLPKFKHTINSVMQVKDKASGELTGDYALVFDADSGQYVLQKIDDGQENLFDSTDADYVDAEYKEIEGAVYEAAAALPEAAHEPEIEGDNNYPTEDDSGDTDDSSEYSDETDDEIVRAFAWLTQYDGQTLSVRESMGDFTVRNSRNAVILSSGAKPDNTFYCAREVLAPHLNHALKCVGYLTEQDTYDHIAIECPECGETLFTMQAPWAKKEYEYEKPEE